MKRSKWVYIFGTLILMVIILCVCLGIFAALNLLPDLSLGGSGGGDLGGGGIGSGGSGGGGIGGGGIGGDSGVNFPNDLSSDHLSRSVLNLLSGIRYIGIPLIVIGVILLCIGIYKFVKKRWLAGSVLSISGVLLIVLGLLTLFLNISDTTFTLNNNIIQIEGGGMIDISGLLGNIIMQVSGVSQGGGGIGGIGGGGGGGINCDISDLSELQATLASSVSTIALILKWMKIFIVILGVVFLVFGIYYLIKKKWIRGTLLSIFGAILILLSMIGFSFQFHVSAGGSGGEDGEQHQVQEWIIDREATCIETGLKHGECIICGELVEEEIPLTEHQFGEWEVMKESTCVEAGYRERVCEVCGHTEKEELPLAEHQFGEDGVCEICGLKPQPITLRSPSYSKIYDGKPLTATGLEIVEGSLLPGHTISVIDRAVLTDVGIRDNILQVKILDENGSDVTNNYRIDREYGTLEIVSKTMTIETGSATKQYDGTPLICHEYTQEGLLQGHTISIGYYAGKQTDPGRSDNAVENVQIFDENGKDVTHNYSIELIFGILRVT